MNVVAPAFTRFFCTALIALTAAGQPASRTPRLYEIAGKAGPPTDEETLYLELANRARLDPRGEAERLRSPAADDAGLRSAYTAFKVDTEMLAREIAALPPAPPLAFNARLLDMARAHSQDMLAHAMQSHTGSNGSTLAERAAAAGYPFTRIGENVYSHAKSVALGHASFEVDWGEGPGGMQPHRGHRANLHQPDFREIGVGVQLGTRGEVGPQVVTQNLGNRLGLFPLLTGVAYFDFNRDGAYSLGEGLGGVSVRVSGGDFQAVTTSSGAFAVPLPGNGRHGVTFDGLGFTHAVRVTVAKGANAKLDFAPAYTPPVLDSARAAGPAATDAPGLVIDPHATLPFSRVPGATAYELISHRIAGRDPREPADSAASVLADVTPKTSFVQRRVKMQGAAAFALRHDRPVSQSLTLRRRFFVNTPAAALSFASLLGPSGPAEHARVEISADDGATWSVVSSQTGAGRNGERGFSTREIALAPFAGRVITVRFVYALTEGAFLRGPAAAWFIDDLRFRDCLELADSATTTIATGAPAAFSAAVAGDYLLAVRPYNQRRPLPTGPWLRVTARAPSVEGPPRVRNSAYGAPPAAPVE